MDAHKSASTILKTATDIHPFVREAIGSSGDWAPAVPLQPPRAATCVGPRVARPADSQEKPDLGSFSSPASSDTQKHVGDECTFNTRINTMPGSQTHVEATSGPPVCGSGLQPGK